MLEEEIEGCRQSQQQGIDGITAREGEGLPHDKEGDGAQCPLDKKGVGQEQIPQMGVDAEEVFAAVAVAVMFGFSVGLPGEDSFTVPDKKEEDYQSGQEQGKERVVVKWRVPGAFPARQTFSEGYCGEKFLAGQRVGG